MTFLQWSHQSARRDFLALMFQDVGRSAREGTSPSRVRYMRLTEEEKKERELLQKRILGKIETLEEVVAVRNALQQWLERHPDDAQLLGEGESLVMLESAFLILSEARSKKGP